jgi:hypothetical protein
MTDTVRRSIFLIWGVLGFLWLMFVPVIGLAFDGGDTWKIRLFVGLYLSYPVLFVIALLLRKKASVFAFLPVLSIVGCFIADKL